MSNLNNRNLKNEKLTDENLNLLRCYAMSTVK